MTRLDAAVAAGFVLAAVAEAVALHRSTPGLLASGVCGAPALAVLAVRRTRPLLAITVITAVGLVGMLIQALLWPHADNSGGVWIFAMLLASYSLGAHGHGRVVVLGGVMPLVLVLAADLPTMAGWALVSGVLFVTAFIGVLPTAAGRLVRARRERLAVLDEQRDLIISGRHDRREATVLAERLRTADRLQPVLLEGLRALADSAEEYADPGAIETTARDLLSRTRIEVVELTSPIQTSPGDPVIPTQPDHVRALRAAAQPWTVLAGGGIAVGLALESTRTLPLMTPSWVAVLAALATGVPLTLLWWRPLTAVTVAWCAVAAFSHRVAPLDGSLAESAMVAVSAFAVALLSRRRAAVVGLVVCWLGQLVGVHASGALGDAAFVLVCWLGGVAVNELSRLVEQGHANNRLLAEQETAAAELAIVEERLRMARELHDHIGHSLTVVTLQAGAARRLTRTDPDRARAVMETIAAAAREGADALGASETGRDLAALLDRTRSAGLALDADLGGYALLEPAEQALAYRVTQEALTNVLRHAPGARASVAVRRVGEELTVTVRNSAPTRTPGGPGSGRGLAGIRERVGLLAGRVEWGPRADGGFELRAVVPVSGLEGAPR